MKNNKHYFILAAFILLLITTGNEKINAQTSATSTQSNTAKTDPADEMKKLRDAVEAKPDDFDTHWAYIKAMKFDSSDLIKQYDAWIKKYPRSVLFPYAIGEALNRRANPNAKTYLFKALEIDPAYHQAYFALWGDAQRWGEFKKGTEYILKAKELDPQNADYAFYYAHSFDDSNPELYKKLCLEVARTFPDTDRGAQALYWLAHHTKDIKERIAYYEQQRKDFPADKFSWTGHGMSSYFDLLLIREPSKAKTLAQSMADLVGKDDKTWPAKIKLAQDIEDAKKLLSGGKASEAVSVLDKITLPRYSQFMADIILFKSEVQDAANNTADAYQTLLTYTAKDPTKKINEALISYGKKLKKDELQVNKDILYVRDTASKQAPKFTLENYFTKNVASLSDYKGKVILLTYWYPGCGPCRAEFPYFENVVRKFKGKEFVYLGINIYEKEDEYVVPFVKSSGYSFIPLKDNKKWEKGPLENRGLAPVNFLIDKDGKIIFSWFRTDEHNEATLEMMINSLLTGKAISSQSLSQF